MPVSSASSLPRPATPQDPSCPGRRCPAVLCHPGRGCGDFGMNGVAVEQRRHASRNASYVIERVYVVGALIRDGGHEKGNLFTVPKNRYAEFNMFLDQLAAKTVLESNRNITIIPLTRNENLLLSGLSWKPWNKPSKLLNQSLSRSCSYY